MAVSVQYIYGHSYCVLHGYSDRGGVGEREWQYVYSTYTATVTVSCMDTLTEAYMINVSHALHTLKLTAIVVQACCARCETSSLTTHYTQLTHSVYVEQEQKIIIIIIK